MPSLSLSSAFSRCSLGSPFTAGLGILAPAGRLAADIPLEAIIGLLGGSLHREIWLAIPLFVLSGYLNDGRYLMHRMIMAFDAFGAGFLGDWPW